jgi:hypothetical protein
MSAHLYKCSNISVDGNISMKSEDVGHKFSVLMLISISITAPLFLMQLMLSDAIATA